MWIPVGEDSPTKPSKRNFAAAVYHAGRRTLYVCGGKSEGGYENDVWALRLSDVGEWKADGEWSLVWSSNEAGKETLSKRFGHAMVYCEPADSLIVLGGRETASTLSEPVCLCMTTPATTSSPLLYHANGALTLMQMRNSSVNLLTRTDSHNLILSLDLSTCHCIELTHKTLTSYKQVREVRL